MDNYIVSARKYRPSTFRSVVGQKSLTTTLKMQYRVTSWLMPTSFAVPVEWARLLVPVSLPRRSIV